MRGTNRRRRWVTNHRKRRVRHEGHEEGTPETDEWRQWLTSIRFTLLTILHPYPSHPSVPVSLPPEERLRRWDGARGTWEGMRREERDEMWTDDTKKRREQWDTPLVTHVTHARTLIPRLLCSSSVPYGLFLLSLRPEERGTEGSEEPRKGRRTTDILHHIWSVSRLPPLRCAKRMSERMSVHLRPLMSYPFRVPRSRLRRFLVSLHSIAPRSGRDRARPAALGDGWGEPVHRPFAPYVVHSCLILSVLSVAPVPGSCLRRVVIGEWGACRAEWLRNGSNRSVRSSHLPYRLATFIPHPRYALSPSRFAFRRLRLARMVMNGERRWQGCGLDYEAVSPVLSALLSLRSRSATPSVPLHGPCGASVERDGSKRQENGWAWWGKDGDEMGGMRKGWGAGHEWRVTRGAAHFVHLTSLPLPIPFTLAALNLHLTKGIVHEGFNHPWWPEGTEWWTERATERTKGTKGRV